MLLDRSPARFNRSSARRAARAEDRVRSELDSLRERGFIVVHGAETSAGDATDHLISGPSGVFLVNARHRSSGSEDLAVTWRRAEELFRELHTWVTPVLCLASPPKNKPFRHDRVWIVRLDQVAGWIARQRNPVLENERIAHLAERLAAPSPAPDEEEGFSSALLELAKRETVAQSTIEPAFDGDPSI